jgi:methylenetetrahydrofolate reductase (NADPH)
MANDAAAAGAGSNLGKSLKGGRFVVTAELTPPVSTDPTDFLAKAAPLKGLVTAVNITDGASAKAHMSTAATCYFLRQSGIEPIMQMACRDRNRIALQSDLIGASAMGIHNLLFLTGDDPKAGDQPDAKPVFDLNSQALLAVADKMRKEHKLPPGTEIKGPLDFVLGATDVPVDPPADWAPKSLQAKVGAGADFIQTQFCMDIGVVKRYAARLLDLGIAQKLRILIGVCPIPSAKSATWMREKLFGTTIPDSIITRLEQAADPKAECKKLCAEFMQQLAEVPGIGGAHIMAPVNPSAIPEVIAMAGVAGKKLAG